MSVSFLHHNARYFRTRKLKETLADFNPQIEFQQLQLRVF